MSDGSAVGGFNLTDPSVDKQWGDLLEGGFNDSESLAWRREYAHQYQLRHKDDPQVKYAVLIFYLIMFTILGSQSALFYWKKIHKRSYELVTLLGLWVVPAVFSFYFHFWLFLAAWTAFSSATMYTLHLASEKRMAPSTPQKVYTFFLAVYKTSVVVGVGGYALLVLEVFGVGALLRPVLSPVLSVQMLWYGLYFGVLGRDCAEVVSDTLVFVSESTDIKCFVGWHSCYRSVSCNASHLADERSTHNWSYIHLLSGCQASTMGTWRRLAVSVRSCGVCTQELPPADFGSPNRSDVVQLSCKHLFHGFCIRGWTIVGKKDTCPVCLEKVDLRSIFADRPWETRNLNWNQMLDMIRYLVVWNPLILMALHFTLHLVGLDSQTSSQPAPAPSLRLASGPLIVLGDASDLLVNATAIAQS